VGGYPQIKPVYRALQVPKDNIKAWLDSFIPAGNKPQEP
jgi:hypothetical protein